jgi:hypothetical protein
MSREVRTSVVVVRRLLAGIVITPAIAGAYVLGYALLVANGAGQSSTLNEIISNGLLFGGMFSLVFALAPILDK